MGRKKWEGEGGRSQHRLRSWQIPSRRHGQLQRICSLCSAIRDIQHQPVWYAPLGLSASRAKPKRNLSLTQLSIYTKETILAIFVDGPPPINPLDDPFPVSRYDNIAAVEL
ncbi:hypothetical protein RRG08_026259 [Elysia crispata]|uniref:Uncharacterized protein n=1 Tax=Elysia crispata TaxID=231223 RepID=A0AAE0ZAC2_9GAST|nr:hypothetical protein RRG08_026259 [Elysia crispata]